MKQILTSLAVCMLLSQVSVAKPTAHHEDHFKDFDLCKLKSIYEVMASTDKDHTLEPSVQLMKLIAFDFQNLSLTYVRKAKNISDHLLKESVFCSNQSPEILKFKQQIEDFQKKFKTCSDMVELFDMVELYSNATSPYYEMESNGTLSTDSKIILDVLKKYSPNDMDENFEEKFSNTFVTNFSRKIDELKEKLKAEDGGMGEKVLQWWENVKSLNTVEEKMEAFKEYMKLYGFEE